MATAGRRRIEKERKYAAELEAKQVGKLSSGSLGTALCVVGLGRVLEKNDPCWCKQAYGFGLCLKRKIERKEKVTLSEIKLRKEDMLSSEGL